MKSVIFNTQEVIATLEGRKNQFRQVAKNIKFKSGINQNFTGLKPFKFGKEFRICGSTDEVCEPFEAPFQVGENIFVKERFQLASQVSKQEIMEWRVYRKMPLGYPIICYEADKSALLNHMDQDFNFSVGDKALGEWDIPKKWKPATHMKQHQSRLTPRITYISVERLQNIGYESVLKEGFTEASGYHPNYLSLAKCTIDKFKEAWNLSHKNPNEKFEANPWVFKVSFEVVK